LPLFFVCLRFEGGLYIVFHLVFHPVSLSAFVCLFFFRLAIRCVSGHFLFLGEPNSIQVLFSLGDWVKQPRSLQMPSRQPSKSMLHSAGFCFHP